jgi:transcriptional regulator with XRE-family HTH domain
MNIDTGTLPEFLKNPENQIFVLEKIKESLRVNREWGKRGLFAKIGKKIGISPAYIGQVFNGKKPVRENFVAKIADYLQVSVEWLREESSTPYDIEKLDFHFRHLSQDELDRYIEARRREVENGEISFDALDRERFRDLIDAFLKIPVKEMERAIFALQVVALEKTEESVPKYP